METYQEDSTIKIKFAKLREDVILPSKDNGNVGYDIYANFTDDYMLIRPHSTVMIPTGLESIIPNGFAIILKDRGSTGSKGISTACGVIDSSFRGEWFVALHNENNIPVFIVKDNVTEETLNNDFPEYSSSEKILYPYKKAITQGILIEDVPATIIEVDTDTIDSNVTARGKGITGSSGK